MNRERWLRNGTRPVRIFRPKPRFGKGAAKRWEVIALPGNRPGTTDYYLRLPRTPHGTNGEPTMPYRKVRFHEDSGD